MSSSEFNFACSKCPRTFKLAEFYEKHKKVHELKKQHVCRVCGYVYGAAKGLEGHMKTHESSSAASSGETSSKGGASTLPCRDEGLLRQSPASSPPQVLHGTGNYRVYEVVPDVGDGTYQNGIGYYVCELCSREFSGLNSLKKHMPIHGRSIQHKCDICGFVYGKKEYLTEHSKLHMGTLPCEICGQLFNKVNKLKDHLRCHKNIAMDGSKNESVPFKCHICQDVYAEAFQLKAHLVSSHSPGAGEKHDPQSRLGSSYEKCVWCPLCSQGFTRHYNLKMHLYKIHGKETIENNFSAEELAGLLSSRSGVKDSPGKSLPPSLKANHYFDASKETQMLACHLCSDAFLRKNDLWIHLESTHGAILPVCRVCEDKFSDLAELKEHIELAHGRKRKPGPASRTHPHPLNRSESCQCPECGLILPERISLNTHIKLIHRVASGGDQQEPQHCELCQKDFPSLLDLETHQKGKHPNLNKRLQNLRDALFPEPKKMKLEVNDNDDEDAHKAETDIIALNHQTGAANQPPSSSSATAAEIQASEEECPPTSSNNTSSEDPHEEDCEEEDDVQYVPIMEDFYFEDMIIHPCYVIIPFVSDEEIEAACSLSQQHHHSFDEFDEDQGRLTIDEDSYDENASDSMKNVDTPFSGEHDNFNRHQSYNADDIKSETPHMGFYPDNISDFSLPFTLSGLWKKKADILGPNAMKQADLLEKQIKKINDYEKRQKEKHYRKDSDADRSLSPMPPLQNLFKREGTPELNGGSRHNNNYISNSKRKSNGDIKYQKLPKISSSSPKEDSADELKYDDSLYPGSPGKGHRVKTSPHKAPDAHVSKYEIQIQQNRWPVECIKCDLKLNDLQCFNIHMNDHWTGDKRCPVCKLLINSKRFNFKQHLKIHTGEKPFVCDICKRSFRQKAHMVKHVTTHRSISSAQIKMELPAGL